MAKIIAPNKNYTGVTANVKFNKGIGETSDAYLITWFEAKGYKVEFDTVKPLESSKFDNMSVDELIDYTLEYGIDIGKSTSKNGILQKILKAEGE